MSEFTFLTEEQCFGDDKLEILEKRGTKVAVSDFSILLGGIVCDGLHIEGDSSLEGRTGYYWTKSDDGDGSVNAVDGRGASYFDKGNMRDNGARLALPFSSIEKNPHKRKECMQSKRWHT